MCRILIHSIHSAIKSNINGNTISFILKTENMPRNYGVAPDMYSARITPTLLPKQSMLTCMWPHVPPKIAWILECFAAVWTLPRAACFIRAHVLHMALQVALIRENLTALITSVVFIIFRKETERKTNCYQLRIVELISFRKLFLVFNCVRCG